MAQKADLQERGAPHAAATRWPLHVLAGFVKYLEESGFMRLHEEGGEPYSEADWAALDGKIRLQALVMLANRFGLGSPYACDRYAFGPVSVPLAEDSGALSRNRAGLYDGVKAEVPSGFKRKEFEDLVRGRDTDWLMAASKMTRLSACRSTRRLLVESMLGDRPAYTEEYVSGLLGVLERSGLVTAYR